MAKAKEVVFEDEDTLTGIEKLQEPEVKTAQPSTDDIDSLFNSMPIQVEEVPQRETVVEVIPIRDFRCSYAGVMYYFSKGKRQLVPVDVRDFLLKNKQQPKIKDLW
jgi:hypothetical protein